MQKTFTILFDENLQETTHEADRLQNYVESLQRELASTQDARKRVKILGDLGVYLRILRRLDESLKSLQEALSLIQENSFGSSLEIQQKIRLGHSLQWMKRFVQSDAVFTELLKLGEKDSEGYYDFILQHAGKNQFDQKKYEEALSLFTKALEIRLQKGSSQDLVESCRQAIQRTEFLLERKT